MKIFLDNKLPVRLSIDKSFVLIVASSLLLTLIAFLIQPISFSAFWTSLVENIGINFLLNWFPILFAMLILYFLGLGAVPTVLTISSFVISFGLINRFMILFRHDPLMPWDIQLGAELFGIIDAFDMQFFLPIILAGIVFLIIAVLLCVFVRSERLEPSLRAIALTICLIIALLANFIIYNDEELNLDMYVAGTYFSAIDRHNSKGFLYSFIYYLNTTSGIATPEGYDPETIRELIAEADTSGIRDLQDADKPHIVMVMGEAFSELSMSEHFDFSGRVDPLENYQNILEDSISGDIFVHGFGGATAETEFDVLTGLNSRHFAEVPFAFRMINSDFDSLASILGEIGYRSSFFHPGEPWFYNRYNVYAHLGFEDRVFVDSFSYPPLYGEFVREDFTIDHILQMFDESVRNHPNVPYFSFSVTIQNHGPYLNKYPDIEIPNFETDLDLSADEENELSNFFHGVKSADAGIQQMVDRFNATSEPVVLVYFSDHQPMLSNEMFDQVFPDNHEPGSKEDLTRLRDVPFFIWFNQAALDLYEIDHISELTDDEDIFISASFLGAYVMELLGFRYVSPFMDFNMDLRQQIPIVHQYRSFDPYGRPSDYFFGEELLPLEIYQDWSYFKLFDDD